MLFIQANTFRWLKITDTHIFVVVRRISSFFALCPRLRVCMLDVNNIGSLKSQRQSPSLPDRYFVQISRFPVNSRLFSLCFLLSLSHSFRRLFWVFSSHFNRLESNTYVTNISRRIHHRGMEIIQKTTHLCKNFTGFLPVSVCVVKLTIRIEMERNGYNYYHILSLISYVTCKYIAHIYIWNFGVLRFNSEYVFLCFLFSLNYSGNFFFLLLLVFFQIPSLASQLNYASFAKNCLRSRCNV